MERHSQTSILCGMAIVFGALEMLSFGMAGPNDFGRQGLLLRWLGVASGVVAGGALCGCGVYVMIRRKRR